MVEGASTLDLSGRRNRCRPIKRCRDKGETFDAFVSRAPSDLQGGQGGIKEKRTSSKVVKVV
jgi:hypothetical protein